MNDEDECDVFIGQLLADRDACDDAPIAPEPKLPRARLGRFGNGNGGTVEPRRKPRGVGAGP